MDAITKRSSHRPSGLRAGIIIGLALALLGAVVGTATGAVTPFQKVVITNTASEPIPVVGTVSVSNTPANQAVTVSNFPATQAVTVSNFPATQPVSGTVSVGDKVTKSYTTGEISFDNEHSYDFGRTINVTMLHVDNPDNDALLVYLVTTAGQVFVGRIGDGMLENFTMPVPATSVRIQCGNGVLDCTAAVDVLGS